MFSDNFFDLVTVLDVIEHLNSPFLILRTRVCYREYEKIRCQSSIHDYGPKKGYYKRVFGSGADWDIEIRYIEQKNPNGIAHTISLAENYISDPFLVTLGDDLTIAKSLNNIAETFSKNNAWAIKGVVVEENMDVIKRTCSITMHKTWKIIDIEEKPVNANSNLRGCGLYFFDPMVFDYIRKTPELPPRNEVEITNTLKLMAKESKAYASLIDGVNININTYQVLMRAKAFFCKDMQNTHFNFYKGLHDEKNKSNS
jgi:glucose-1-phosphate thymidylyltransferase